MDFKNFGEVFIAAAAIVYAIYILYKRIKNNNNQCSSCGSCSKMCPHYKDRENKS